MQHYTVLLFVLFFTTMIGCRDPQVMGTVKFSDGTPLTSGMVVLQNEERQGVGELRSDGTFSIYQMKPGDGLRRGVYRGYINNAMDPKTFASLVDMKYTSMESSGISYDSKNGSTLDIVVEKPVKGKSR